MKEAAELAANPSADFHAEPLEEDLFEWHFTLRGPPAPSAYEGGIYHGRIILPSQYPLRPPAFRFMTPTGRFEPNREICLSISGHHEETWQPAWGIRTAMVAIRSFMDTDAKGQLGGIECSPQARKKMAAESGAFKCAQCGKTNAEIMKERAEAAAAIEADEKKPEHEVPTELRLAYRDELEQKAPEKSEKSEKSSDSSSNTPVADPPAPSNLHPTPTVQVPAPRTVTPNQQQQQQQPSPLAWIDACIYGVVAALLFLIVRKFS